MDLDFLSDEQEWMAKQVVIPTTFQAFAPHDLIFGIDIQYVEEEAYCAISVYHFNGNHYQTFLYKTQTGMKYVSGFFCFREGPPILRTIRKILNQQNLMPKLIIIDGHGIAHPRKLGIASWVGVQTNIPCMGIAKRPLLPYEGTLAPQRGASLPIFLKKELVGQVLRTQDSIKPVFVSPGYKVSLEQASDIALQMSPDYRIANPIRIADQTARIFSKGERAPNVIVL